ncbi:MAG TPA: hypothetical protein V6C95_06245 [Coleofasciculaceae cyanobacterium]
MGGAVDEACAIYDGGDPLPPQLQTQDGYVLLGIQALRELELERSGL